MREERVGSWENLGLWAAPAQPYDDACAALADAVGGAATLVSGCSVADVGCGGGAQLVRWLARFDVGRVAAHDVEHAAAARRCVQRAGYRGRVAVTASSLAVHPAAAFDRVVSLDAAYHFDLRRDFLRESARVLKPGGRIGFSDLAVDRPAHHGLRVAAKVVGIPPSNLWTRHDFVRELQVAGFGAISVDVFTDEVLRGFLRAVRCRPFAVAPVASRHRVWATAALCHWGLRHGLDYLVVSAERVVGAASTLSRGR